MSQASGSSQQSSASSVPGHFPITKGGIAGHYFFVPIPIVHNCSNVTIADKNLSIFVPFTQNYSKVEVTQSYAFEGMASNPKKPH